MVFARKTRVITRPCSFEKPPQMTFKLGNPPIIEGSIRAVMIPSPESIWDWEDVERMLKTYSDELPITEIFPSWTSQPKGLEKGKLPKEIEISVKPKYARVRTESRSKIVQVGQNELLVLRTRLSDAPYPGFSQLNQDFDDALSRYCEHIATDGVESANLHYVDLIVIPEMYGQGLDLHDYFVGSPEFPSNPFGELAQVSWSTMFKCPPNSPDFARLSVQMLRPDATDGRFRLDWHCFCPEFSSLDRNSIAERLDAAHNYLISCFKAVCKDPVWNLFDPIVP